MLRDSTRRRPANSALQMDMHRRLRSVRESVSRGFQPLSGDSVVHTRQRRYVRVSSGVQIPTCALADCVKLGGRREAAADMHFEEADVCEAGEGREAACAAEEVCAGASVRANEGCFAGC